MHISSLIVFVSLIFLGNAKNMTNGPNITQEFIDWFQRITEQAYVFNGNKTSDNFNYILSNIQSKYSGNWFIYIQSNVYYPEVRLINQTEVDGYWLSWVGTNPYLPNWGYGLMRYLNIKDFKYNYWKNDLLTFGSGLNSTEQNIITNLLKVSQDDNMTKYMNKMQNQLNKWMNIGYWNFIYIDSYYDVSSQFPIKEQKYFVIKDTSYYGGGRVLTYLT